MKEHGVIAIIKKHVLTAIGYMIPLVVAAGLCMALGQFIDGDVRNSTSGIGWYLYKAGGFGMSAVVPVITAGVAYSIADRPGIAPGLILGFICTEIKAGFIGGIVAGFLVGYLVLAVKKICKASKRNAGIDAGYGDSCTCNGSSICSYVYSSRAAVCMASGNADSSNQWSSEWF